MKNVPETAAADNEKLENGGKVLDEALSVLNERERRIFEARNLTDPPITLKKLGDELGLSCERVRQIDKIACEKVRSAVEHHFLALTVKEGLEAEPWFGRGPSFGGECGKRMGPSLSSDNLGSDSVGERESIRATGAAARHAYNAPLKEDDEKQRAQERAEEALGRKETPEEKSDREEREEEKKRIERENRPLMDERWENKTTLSMLEAKAAEGSSIKAALRAEYQFLLAQFEARGGKPPPGKRISRKQYLADPEYYRPKWREKYVPNLASSPAGWAFASSLRAYAEWWDRYSATLPRAPAPPARYHGVGAAARYHRATATPAWAGYTSLPVELRLEALGLHSTTATQGGVTWVTAPR